MLYRESWLRWRAAPFLVLVCLVSLIFVRQWYYRAQPLNVILITLDTTRADRLGVYGYQDGETSSFDRYAQQGVLFERAYSPAPITLPSHATMLTGLYPPEHGLRVNGEGCLPAEIPLLPQILKNHGFRTAAFIAAPVLDSIYGLNRGFELYDDFASQKRIKQFQQRRRPGGHVIDQALSWLGDHTQQQFFCWIHVFDAHAPYKVREDIFGERFKSNPYDAGVAAELLQVERVITFLKERRLDQNTLVIITADHGEGLGDHHESEHGMLAYNSTLHVPLVFVGTKHCQPGKRISTTVSLADITPTILDVLNIRAPVHVSGRSLKAALAGGEIPANRCYAEAESPFALNHLCPLHVVIMDRWKYIQTTRPELYDLFEDPAEEKNLVGAEVEQQKELENVLELMQQSFVVAKPQKLKLSHKQMSDLNALGYAGIKHPSADAERAKSLVLKDVKDLLPALERYEEAKRLSLEGKVDAAIALLREIEVMAGPGECLEAGWLLGDCLALTDRADEAVEVFLRILALHPDVEQTRFRLGWALAKRGQYQLAADEFRTTIKHEPDSALAHFELAKMLVKLNKAEEAIAEFREAIRIAPELPQTHFELGQLFLSQKRLREAANCFEQTLRFEPQDAVAQASLLGILVQLREFAKAFEYAKKSVELDPTSFEAHFNLGILLISQNRFREGISVFRQAQKLRPDDPRPLQQIQQAESVLNRIGK